MNEFAIPVIAAAIAIPVAVWGWQAAQVSIAVDNLTALTAPRTAPLNLDLNVESLKENMFGHATVIVKITNNTDRSFGMVFAECAFLGSDKIALETGLAVVNNLGPGRAGYGQATVVDGKPVKSVTCRISQTM